MADHFNLIFSNLRQFFGNINDEVPSFLPGDSSFSFGPITVNDCYDIINELKPNKPTGPCKVPAKGYNGWKQVLTSHLTFILNECINESVFPTMLKRATITPIFKKVGILDPKNIVPFRLQQCSPKSSKNVFIGKLQHTLKKKSRSTPIWF